MDGPQPRTGTRLERVLVRGALAWWNRYLAWVRRHPLLTDAALVVALFWLSGANVGKAHKSHQVLVVAFTIAVLLPLIWRRRAPFAVFLIIAALAAVQLFVTPLLSDDVALLVAFYTVAAYDTSRRALTVAAVLVIGAIPAAVLNARAGIDVFWVWVFCAGLIAAAGLTGWYVRTRRAHLVSLADRAQRLERERDQQAQLAAAAERERIAREMHDIVAHNIAVMIALADGAAYTVADRPGQAADLMGQVSATGRSALAEMRRLLGVLRQPAPVPGHAPQPTLADIDALLVTVRAAGLPVRLTVTGRPAALPPSAELTLYRMIQEALTNTLKHAAASSAEVRLSYQPGQVGLEVTDDGRPGAGPSGPGLPGPGLPGSMPSVTVSGAGHGIAGMRERAAVFGGEVSAGPCDGGGWRVHTVLRLDPASGNGRATATEDA